VTHKKYSDAAEILARVIAELRDLPPKEQQKLLDTVATFYGLHNAALLIQRQTKATAPTSPVLRPPGGGFSEPRDISAKEFLLQKQPRTDVERVACLAFYLTHYKNTPHFKTIDISKLNTEAAQSKFSNTAMAVENATKTGYLVPASRGNKQLSAAGEVFVQALPDREAAKLAMSKLKPRRKTRKAERRDTTARRRK